MAQKVTKYDREREAHKATVQISIRTKAPSKWRFVDLETGDVWRWDEYNGTYQHVALHEFRNELDYREV